MPRKANRSRGSGKAVIYVFCEGESEKAYTRFLKEKFADVAVIRTPSEVGANVFERARDRFRHDPKYQDEAEMIDEIWLFFDVETKDAEKWEARLKILRALRKLRPKDLRVRLLMTTGCLEYWLLLHYKLVAPSIQTPEQKKAIEEELRRCAPAYTKGDYPSTAAIAGHYPTAVENARSTVHRLTDEGLPTLQDTDARNAWLYRQGKTFSTVYEAIEFLED
ncbi:MAG: RloB family protein, partial [bacterium]